MHAGATSAGASDASAPARVRGAVRRARGGRLLHPGPGRGSRGSLLSVSGRLGAGDCWRGAWNLTLVPLRLRSRSGPLRSSLTPGELSLLPRCRPISRGRKMPSNVPTVSRGDRGAPGWGGPRPRRSRGPSLLLAAPPSHCGWRGGRRGLPAADPARSWA